MLGYICFQVYVARLWDESWQIVGVEGDISSCQLSPRTSIEMFWGKKNAITKEVLGPEHLLVYKFLLSTLFKGRLDAVICPMAMHLILNFTCFNLPMRNMNNILYILLNESVFNLES